MIVEHTQRILTEVTWKSSVLVLWKLGDRATVSNLIVWRSLGGKILLKRAQIYYDHVWLEILGYGL